MILAVFFATFAAGILPRDNTLVGEVVGSTGRIGSFFIESGNGQLAATPRDSTPGLLSPRGTPIIIATPAGAIEEVLATTPKERWGDLVLFEQWASSRKGGKSTRSRKG